MAFLMLHALGVEPFIVTPDMLALQLVDAMFLCPRCRAVHCDSSMMASVLSTLWRFYALGVGRFIVTDGFWNGS
jgi:hypothetical protein